MPTGPALALVTRIAVLAARVDHLVAALRLPGRAPLRDAIGGVAATLLHAPERDALGAALYDVSLSRARTFVPRWESTWLSASLPAAPARVLIGGAGTGREARHLRALGHTIDALEPAPRSASRCRAAVPDAIVATATYQQLAAAVLDGVSNDASPIASRHYDAVLLGWTSLMHVTSSAERARLFAALARIAPEGPWLATFYPRERAAPHGSAHRVGARAGRALAALRRAPITPAGDTERFGLICGFVDGLPREELESHARAHGRRVRWDGEDEGALRITLHRA